MQSDASLVARPREDAGLRGTESHWVFFARRRHEEEEALRSPAILRRMDTIHPMRFQPLLLWLVLLLLLSGCAGSPPKTSPASGLGEQVAGVAASQVGAPYRYGGTGPGSFDCSGLVHYAYRQLGLEVPRTTGGQLRAISRVSVGAVQPGDLLFFRINGKVSHVGLYTGKSRFVHAPSSGKHVSFSDLENPYWKRRLVAARRLH